jgi:putative ABC transport system permease protein
VCKFIALSYNFVGYFFREMTYYRDMATLRHAFRVLAKNPALSIAAIVCLALGIGANTAIFTVVNTVLLRPLPYKDPDRLVRVYTEFPTYGSSGGFRKFWMSPPELLDLRRLTSSWEYLEAYLTTGVNLSGSSEPIRVTAANITGGVMPMLGVTPQIGRALNVDDDRPGVPLTTVISDGLWRRAFGGAPDIAGRQVKVNGLTATIVGVMPAGFAFPPGETDPADLWYPQQIDPAKPGGRAGHYESILGKLKPGVTLEHAREEFQRIMVDQGQNRTQNTHLFDTKFHTILALPFHGEVIGNVRPAMLLMLGAVVFVLLISCVNVGNLLLARAEARHHEIAVRKAVGASLFHLGRLCLAEGLVLAFAGALAGVAVAWGALRLILAFNQGAIPRAGEIGVDWRVLAFTVAASVLTGLFFGLAPLAQFAGDTQESLKTATGRSTTTSGAHWLRRVMVVSELALALILLVGAGLMVRTFWKLQQVHIGLDPARIVTMRIVLPQGQYPQSTDVRLLWDRLIERVSGLPGVESATVASGFAPLRQLNANDTDIEGYVKAAGGPDSNIDYYQIVSPGYFETFHIPIVEGRAFDVRDGADANHVAIVNQTLARTFYGSQSPIGRRVRESNNPPAPWRTIVGVAADVKNAGIDKPTGTELYFASDQAEAYSRGMSLAVKTTGDPQQIVGVVRAKLAEIDPSLPVAQVRLMEDIITAANGRPRFLTVLLGLFSFLALALAAVGIYGVMAFLVERRTQEFGIRMAIGASPGNVLGLVLGQGVVIGLVGVAVGAAGALALTRFMRQVLFGVATFDPLTFVATALLLTAVVLAACWVPARRATRVDPMIALRYE